MVQIPTGKTVRDMLPQFANVKHETNPVGTPCKRCAGCSRAFTSKRVPRLLIKLYPVRLPIPVIILYRLCGSCSHRYRLGGVQRDRVVSAVENFIMGDE
jgi:hypothetical protein